MVINEISLHKKTQENQVLKAQKNHKSITWDYSYIKTGGLSKENLIKITCHSNANRYSAIYKWMKNHDSINASSYGKQ